MIPIFERGGGRGIGLTVDRLQGRFLAICKDHLETGRARAFAFIFYDFIDSDFQSVLEHEGVFTQLDRLAGQKLSVFYLHSRSAYMADEFNAEFLQRIGITEQVHLPCIVFFKLEKDQVRDIMIAELDNTDFATGFHELYKVIENYLDDMPPPKSLKFVRLVWSAAKFVGAQAVGAGLGALFGHLF